MGSDGGDRSTAWDAPACDWGVPWRSDHVLLLEHATAGVERASVDALARGIRAAAAGRRIATLSFGADAEFAAAVADRVLTLDPATGRLAPRLRRWFM